MALIYTAEQNQIRDEARRFLEDAFQPEVQRDLLKKRGSFDTAFWRACIDMGWTGAGVPEEFGGLGLGPLEVCIIAEECGRVIAGAPFLAANYAATTALLECGDESQRSAYLPAIALGKARFAIAILEGDGDLPHQPKSTFADGVIHGRKPGVPGAAAATHALTLTDAGLAIVDLDGPGARLDVMDTIDNSRCAAEIVFDGVKAELLKRSPNIPLRVLSVQATVTAFEQIGGATAAMDRARQYANVREAFGQLIGKFQAIKHRIAEMYLAIELARGNALLAANGLMEGARDFEARAGGARLAASEAFEFAAAQSIQTHGAIGVTWEHDLHLYLRRARALAAELGSRMFWEDVVVDGLREPRP